MAKKNDAQKQQPVPTPAPAPEAPKAEVKAAAKKPAVRRQVLAGRGHAVTVGDTKYLVCDDREESYSGIRLTDGALVRLDPKKAKRAPITHSEFAAAVLSDEFKGTGLPSGTVNKMRNMLNADEGSLKEKCDGIGASLWGSWPVKRDGGKQLTAKA